MGKKEDKKKGRCVLIADDEAKYRLRPEQNTLRKEGYKIHLAIDGAEARKKLRKKEYQLLVLDQSLSDPDNPDKEKSETGLRILQELRSSRSRWKTKHNIPVIVLTGISNEILRDKIENLQAIWCSKPAIEQEFIDVVKKANKRRGSKENYNESIT